MQTTILFVFLLVDGYLQFLATANKTSINIHVQVFGHMLSFFLHE